jgi:hypothetical protein
VRDISVDEETAVCRPENNAAAVSFEYRKQGLFDHCALIKNPLVEIETRVYKIDHTLRSQTCQVILDFHWNHWLPLREVYGLDTLLEAMSEKHPEVV